MTAPATPVSSPSPTPNSRLKLNPARRSTAFVTTMWVLGILSLVVLAFVLKMPLPWATKVLAWVLLTFIADEAGNWFGYLAIPLGFIPFLLATPPQQWYLVFPLIAAALCASLMVKHSGGILVLPFAAALFALPIMAAAKLVPKLDPTITLLTNHNFQRQAFLGLGIGLSISLVRQLIELLLRYNAARRAANAGVSTL